MVDQEFQETIKDLRRELTSLRALTGIASQETIEKYQHIMGDVFIPLLENGLPERNKIKKLYGGV